MKDRVRGAVVWPNRSDTSVNFPVITGRDFTANETGPRVPRCTVIFCRIYGGEVRYDFIMDVDPSVSFGNRAPPPPLSLFPVLFSSFLFFSLPLSLIVVAARCLCKFLIFISQEAAYRLRREERGGNLW